MLHYARIGAFNHFFSLSPTPAVAAMEAVTSPELEDASTVGCQFLGDLIAVHRLLGQQAEDQDE
jgi:hypothetical protein